jgi:hypothetical protein
VPTPWKCRYKPFPVVLGGVTDHLSGMTIAVNSIDENVFIGGSTLNFSLSDSHDAYITRLSPVGIIEWMSYMK